MLYAVAILASLALILANAFFVASEFAIVNMRPSRLEQLAAALVIGGILPTFAIPLWVVLLCAVVMAAGRSIGGWKIMRTLGR